jgi:hypothetical protein
LASVYCVSNGGVLENKPPARHKANRLALSMVCLAIPAHETHCWVLLTLERCNCNGDCAYANGFHVVAEGLDVVC